MGERIKHLYNNTLMSDIHFLVVDKGGRSKIAVPCHKFVLGVSSPVFFAMFYGQLPETAESIDLPECNSEGFLKFLRYIYCGEIKLNGSCVMQVLYLAKKYIIPSLTDRCRRFLEEHITPENVLDLLPQVNKVDEAHVTGVCWKTVDLHTEEVLSYASASLLEDGPLLASMLSRDSLTISEVKIFQAINFWAEEICGKQGLECNGKNKRKVMGDAILKLIRFPVMSQKEFAKHVPHTAILTESEIVQLFMYFSLGGKAGEFSSIPRDINSRSFQRCKRFSATGCFWYYNRGAADIITFSVDVPVFIIGVRLFGSPKQEERYFVNLKICGKTVADDQFHTEEQAIDGYYGFDVIFENRFQLQPDVPCVLVAFIHGTKSCYGISGKEEVACGKVTFRFSGSKEAPLGNGSSVSQGQFAEVLFSCI